MMFNDERAERVYELADETATGRLAARIAERAGPGDVIALLGGLGAGKTSFARAFIRHLADADEEVPSPTFTLLQTYPSRAGDIYHFDLYRIEDADEALELGIEEAFSDGITLIEWAERLEDLLPADRLDVRLEAGTRPESRRATLTGHGRWMAKLAESIDEGAIHA
ncbi:MAG: tRNA (adenosine(37)-N6)-threonylcarbamoyltransferase complex ATPase subunit type 1 TsaE [Rhodospirillaceae bacterium]